MGVKNIKNSFLDRIIRKGYKSIGIAALVAVSINASAQNNSTTAPSGAAGMTTGTPSTTGAQMKLMQVRAQAYQAKKDTEAAALARSTDRALEQRNLSSAVEKSRSIKQIKDEAARQMEFEKASTAYNKVSSNDISRWTDRTGNIKVQRDAPKFNNPLGEPPADAVNPPTQAREETVAEEEKSGFSPFKNAGNAVKKIGGLNPFKKKEETTGLRVPEVDHTALAAKKEKKGFLKGMPLIGKKKDKAEQNPFITSQPEVEVAVKKEKKGFLKGMGEKLPLIGKNSKKNKANDYIQPSAPVQPTAAPPQPITPTTPNSPVRVQGSALVDGISQVPVDNNIVSPVTSNVDSVVTTPAAPAAPTIPEINEKPGFMGRMKNAGNKINPFSKADQPKIENDVAVVKEKTGFMSKLRNKKEADIATTTPATKPAADKPGLMNRLRGNSIGGNRGGSIDASLFPEGATSAAPTGGPLTVDAPAPAVAMTSGGPTGEFAANAQELPGQKKKGFKLPTVTIPDFSEVGKPDPTVPKKWKERTVSHKGGSNYYVVSAATNFMKFGSGQFNSEVNELAAGTVVRMTKPGDEWSSIQLANGATGIVKNKALRPAQQAEVPASFDTAASAPATASLVN